MRTVWDLPLYQSSLFFEHVSLSAMPQRGARYLKATQLSLRLFCVCAAWLVNATRLASATGPAKQTRWQLRLQK
jgi:hypothetical protein